MAGATQVIRITHRAHPLCGQTCEVLADGNGGRPDPGYIAVALPNGERRFIPLTWTDLVPQTDYPAGARFPPEALLALRQRLDQLLLSA